VARNWVGLANKSTKGQFLQHFTQYFFADILLPKNYKLSQNVSRENMRKALSYEKHERKCWWNRPQD